MIQSPRRCLIACLLLPWPAAPVHSQGSFTLYGIADGALVYNARVAGPGGATGSVTAINSGGLQAARLGVRARESLGGGLFAEFGLENGFALDTGTPLQNGALFGRRSVVGLSGPRFGVLHIGRRKDFTDEIARDYSSISPYSGFITAVHANNLDRIGGNRANNIVYYSTPTVAGMRANVTYGFGEAAGVLATGQSFGFGANRDAGPFGIGFGYWQSRLGTAAAPSSDQGATAAGCAPTLPANAGKTGARCIRTMIVGTHYIWRTVTLRGAYSQVRQPLVAAGAGPAPGFATLFTAAPGSDAFTAGGVNNWRARVLDVGMDVRVTPSVRLTTSAIVSRYDFIAAAEPGQLTALLAGAQVYLSKRTTLYGTAGTQRAAAMYNPGMGAGPPGLDRRASFVAAGVRRLF